jgi:hypothetical protein
MGALKTTAMPQMDALAQWLVETLPPNPLCRRSSGDFKLDNLMLDPADRVGRRRVGLGNERARRRWSISAFCSPTGCRQRHRVSTCAHHCDLARGYFTRRDRRSLRRAGGDLSGLRFFEVFALFKIAVVSTIYYRFVTVRPTIRASPTSASVAHLARHAVRIAGT